MKKFGSLLVLCALATLMCVSAPRQAAARPQYLKEFTEKYPKVAAQAMELKCGVCHGEGGKNKKTVSDYGKALGTALGAKNVKDVAKIGEGLDEAAKKDAGDGKTFGDLLADGKLPAAAE
ncbi:hypothetical protein [Planctomicrobium piriforme]|uniref:Cytochrome c domain-containing protein n=1 Tax=Planctomicrobium piriforme TaxID=1576369 RepID=A0A1I3C8R1_9PLAN|nr:hypothetical protein [Planctomicrobium piriforme]SFH70935.1 hypothetical protein SAMN05421753_102173 [Planctomicrobium piriforme]